MDLGLGEPEGDSGGDDDDDDGRGPDSMGLLLAGALGWACRASDGERKGVVDVDVDVVRRRRWGGAEVEGFRSPGEGESDEDGDCGRFVRLEEKAGGSLGPSPGSGDTGVGDIGGVLFAPGYGVPDGGAVSGLEMCLCSEVEVFVKILQWDNGRGDSSCCYVWLMLLVACGEARLCIVECGAQVLKSCELWSF